MGVIRDLERRERMRQKEYLRNISQAFSKTDEKHQPTD